MIEVLPNAMVVIILQYINVSNQHIIHLKLICQLYLNKKRIYTQTETVAVREQRDKDRDTYKKTDIKWSNREQEM